MQRAPSCSVRRTGDCEVNACEVDACEVNACEVNACEVNACGVRVDVKLADLISDNR